MFTKRLWSKFTGMDLPDPGTTVSLVRARYNDGADQWSHFYESRRNRRRMHTFLEFVSRVAVPGEFWLDAGCGTGVLLVEAIKRLGLDVSGCDVSERMTSIASEVTGLPIWDEQGTSFPRRSLFVADVQNLHIKYSKLDGVYASSLFEYVPDIKSALSELRRITRTGGHLVISVPNGSSVLRATGESLEALTALRSRWNSNVKYNGMAILRNHIGVKTYVALLPGTGWKLRMLRYFDGPDWLGPILEANRLLGSFAILICEATDQATERDCSC